MANLKISGYPELLKIDNKKAKTIKELWEDENISKSQKISVENFSVLKGDIRAIFLDEDLKDEGLIYREKLRKYYKSREDILDLSSKERAEQSWPYFRIFYKALKGEGEPTEDLKPELFKKVEEFFDENPDWTIPCLKVFFEFLFLDEETIFRNKAAFEVLEKVEQNEINIIKKNKEYKEKQILEIFEPDDKLKKVQEFDQPFKEEIEVRDIPF